jgi:hypothetical protein
MRRAPTWAGVERELSRARSARRVIPWVLLSALGGAALVAVAARSIAAALPILVPGIAAALFTWMMGIARCPACGASLLRPGEARASSAAPAEVSRTHRCPRCGARFE